MIKLFYKYGGYTVIKKNLAINFNLSKFIFYKNGSNLINTKSNTT